MRRVATIVSSLAMLIGVSNAVAQPSEKVLDAIAKVETGGEADPSNVTADNGKSIGPMCITRACFQDAVEYDKSLSEYKYEDCRKIYVARKVAIAYLTRYCGKTATNEKYCRVWNGGPKGDKKKSTFKYWIKIKKILNDSSVRH